MQTAAWATPVNTRHTARYRSDRDREYTVHNLRTAIVPLIAALVCTAVLVGCDATRPAPEEKTADITAINAFNRQYLQAINDGDSAALDRLTTEDHIMLPPNRSPVIGKSANMDAIKRAFELFEIKESWTPEETEVAGDWAYQRGTYSVTATPRNGGASRTSTGDFLRIYRRQADGGWIMIRDMFNSNQPLLTN